MSHSPSKGAAANVGAVAVASVCAEAEELAAVSSWDKLVRYPDLLRSALAEVAEELTLAVAELRAR